MKKLIFLVFFTVLCFACSQPKKVSVHFLDEFVFRDSVVHQKAIIGGLSGVDYANDRYYFVVDDARNPRVIQAKIILEKNKIKDIVFSKTVLLNDSTETFYKNNILDLESVFVDDNDNMYFVSEGSINYKKQPSIFKTNKEGVFLEAYPLPKTISNLENIKHNAVFEASSKSVDKKGFWVVMEGVLHSDGEEPTFHKTNSPVRFTYYDYETKKPTKQFAYQLEPITKPAKGNTNLNGVTAILEFKKNHFFVIERTYQSGYGSYGNIIRIFEATINNNSTNILTIDSLKNTNFVKLEKRLLFNFEQVKDKLTNTIIDNIEGLTFGPKLSNGNQSLVLVSDDNFQLYGKQLNQFILMEIKEN